MKPILPATLTLLPGALLSAALAGPAAKAPPAKPAQVTINNFQFLPRTLTVPAGTQVSWTNRDGEPHTVVDTAGHFKSHALDTDDTFSYTFAKKGTYDYFCSVHPMMTARVIVR